MCDGPVNILAQLEKLAAYDGPWRPLRDEAPLLRERVRELRERETRLDDLLVIALVGGSGVGKSTLLNALAGDQLAETSEFRPCTSVPTVYHPPGARLGFEGWRCLSGSALEHLVIVDTPDSDTIVREHREIVIDVLGKCDLIMICGSLEKYLDEATWSLLRPLRNERTMVCVETKAGEGEGVRGHWLNRLAEQGFTVAEYFRVSARRTLDRKLAGRETGVDEFDFARLEAFLHHELSQERIRRIKRSNAVGLLRKTVGTLHKRVGARRPDLACAEDNLMACDAALAKEATEIVRQRLFAEPYLWVFALGRETALRGKGIIGTLFRIVELLRTFPVRLAGWLPWIAGRGAGRQAVSLLAAQGVIDGEAMLAFDKVEALYHGKRSEVALALAQAGFEAPDTDNGFTVFQAELNRRVVAVLRGPARDRLVKRARLITCWPAAFLADALPVAFVAFSGYRIVCDYFAEIPLPGSFFLHALVVLALILGVEVLLLSVLGRALAWSARRAAAKDLRTALASHGMAFQAERAMLDQTMKLAKKAEELHRTVAEAAQ